MIYLGNIKNIIKLSELPKSNIIVKAILGRFLTYFRRKRQTFAAVIGNSINMVID